jgi:hypothetical protein
LRRGVCLDPAAKEAQQPLRLSGSCRTFSKYFLDIDKVQRFPITFVVKLTQTTDEIRAAIQAQAVAKYKIKAVVDTYTNAVEEIINVNDLLTAFDSVVKSGKLREVMAEIVAQSKVEFNYNDREEIVEDDDDGDETDA